MKDFITTMLNWKTDLMYSSIGLLGNIVIKGVMKEAPHLIAALMVVLLSPIVAYFGNKILGFIKKKCGLK